VKTRLLPDTDLARITTLPVKLQEKALRQIRDGRPPFSYQPMRSALHDILNVQPAMFSKVSATPWNKIEALLKNTCRSADELKANLRTASALYEFANAANIYGRRHDFYPIQMGPGHRITFWFSMVISFHGLPLVPFVDPRRSKSLTREARRFAFSMMHERIRAAEPDFADVRFGIFQFKDEGDEAQQAVLHTDEGLDLLSMEEMERMVSQTYELWQEICSEREAETRRKATGTSGPLI